MGTFSPKSLLNISTTELCFTLGYFSSGITTRQCSIFGDKWLIISAAEHVNRNIAYMEFQEWMSWMENTSWLGFQRGHLDNAFYWKVIIWRLLFTRLFLTNDNQVITTETCEYWRQKWWKWLWLLCTEEIIRYECYIIHKCKYCVVFICSEVCLRLC